MKIHEFNVMAIVLPGNAPVRVSKLSSPIRDQAFPMTTLTVAKGSVRVHVWWPNGLPDADTQPRANLAILSYLHDLMLEQSIEDASVSATAAVLARTILATSGKS